MTVQDQVVLDARLPDILHGMSRLHLTLATQDELLKEYLRLPPTGPSMRVASLRGGAVLVLFVGLIGRLPVVKVVDLLAG